ncbi:hypothetical protein N9043_00575 [bacterium]|nr:hypothetical protein [bacterium]
MLEILGYLFLGVLSSGCLFLGRVLLIKKGILKKQHKYYDDLDNHFFGILVLTNLLLWPLVAPLIVVMAFIDHGSKYLAKKLNETKVD